MCDNGGIYNINNNKIDQEELIKFTQSLIHRGPDSSSHYNE